MTTKPMLTPSVSLCECFKRSTGFFLALHSPGDSAADIQPVQARTVPRLQLCDLLKCSVADDRLFRQTISP